MAEPSPLGSSQVKFNYKGVHKVFTYTPTGLKPKPFFKKSVEVFGSAISLNIGKC
jgi:hypothetical protein